MRVVAKPDAKTTKSVCMLGWQKHFEIHVLTPAASVALFSAIYDVCEAIEK